MTIRQGAATSQALDHREVPSDHDMRKDADETLRFITKVFLAALAIRWTYSVTLYAVMGENGLLGIDSLDYVRVGHDFASGVMKGSIHGWQWLGPRPIMMPLFTWLLAMSTAIADGSNALVYVLLQGVIDCCTCVLVYYLAADIDFTIAKPAAVAAAVNPTQIVLAGLVYSDTLFLFLVTAVLFGTARWMSEPSWQKSLLVGIALGVALLTRSLAAPLAAVLFAFAVVVAALDRDFRRRRFTQVATVVVIFGIFLGVIVLRNATQYGSWSVTPQSGQHLSRWIVPLIKEVRDGTAWVRGYEEMERKTVERFGPTPTNPFIQSEQYEKVAFEELRRMDIRDIVIAWIYGAAVNLGAPAVVLSPPISSLPRTGFYATGGRTILDKVTNFMFRSDNALYAWILLFGIAGVAAIRAIQLSGLVGLAIRREQRPILILFLLWIAFVLLINGPVASPKYRLPIESILSVFTGAGWVLLRRWWIVRRSA